MSSEHGILKLSLAIGVVIWYGFMWSLNVLGCYTAYARTSFLTIRILMSFETVVNDTGFGRDPLLRLPPHLLCPVYQYYDLSKVWTRICTRT